jgi:tetratricopeptide (TPR) repeat protein
VDLGVCYYNLGEAREAEKLFILAVAKDPHQAVALYNLGIVHERRNDFGGALSYYHRALETSPPEALRDTVIVAMTRVQQKTGKVAPPLPDGR